MLEEHKYEKEYKTCYITGFKIFKSVKTKKNKRKIKNKDELKNINKEIRDIIIKELKI